MRTSCLFFLAAITFSNSARVCHAEEFFPEQQDTGSSRARAKATLDLKEETRGNREFVVLTIKVTTRAGRGKTVRGHAHYTIFKPDGKPWTSFGAKKYSTAKLTQPDHQESQSNTRRFLKSVFDENFGFDEMSASIASNDGVPTNGEEVLNWVKKNATRELKAARKQVIDGTKNSVKGDNWMVRKKP